MDLSFDLIQINPRRYFSCLLVNEQVLWHPEATWLKQSHKMIKTSHLSQLLIRSQIWYYWLPPSVSIVISAWGEHDPRHLRPGSYFNWSNQSVQELALNPETGERIGGYFSLDYIRNGLLQSFIKGRAGPRPQSLSLLQTSPYLLRLSLKRLEVVGDILQLLLQLRTLTVNILNTAGEERGRRE